MGLRLEHLFFDYFYPGLLQSGDEFQLHLLRKIQTVYIAAKAIRLCNNKKCVINFAFFAISKQFSNN